MDLHDLSSPALKASLMDLLRQEANVVVAVILHLAEIARRELHLEEKYSSLFAYCRDELHMPEGRAWRRSTAAALVTRFPEVVPMLRDRRLNESTLCEIGKVLTPENARELLARVAGRTHREVEELAATLRATPAASRSVVTEVPAQGDLFAAAAPRLASESEAAAAGARSRCRRRGPRRRATAATLAETSADAAVAAWSPPPPSRLRSRARAASSHHGDHPANM